MVSQGGLTVANMHLAASHCKVQATSVHTCSGPASWVDPVASGDSPCLQMDRECNYFSSLLPFFNCIKITRKVTARCIMNTLHTLPRYNTLVTYM